MSDPAVYNAILEENKSIQNTIQQAKLEAALTALATEPWNSNNYSLLPLLDNPTGCLCVYDSTSGYFRCGANCTWTVPSGTTKVQFQIWAPGANSHGARCCGGAPFGAVGSYATVIIDAVEGCQYTLCAGCAVCCYPSYAGSVSCGGNSYVTGFGLTGFCAESANPRISCAMCLLHGSSCCRWQAEGRTNSGPCICNTGRWYCFDNSCATCGEIPWIVNPDRTYYGEATTGTVFGLPSYFSSKTCLDTGSNGYHIHPPQISPCHTEQSNSCSCQGKSSGTCGGCCCSACDNCRLFPGAGGTAVFVESGAYRDGDAGRAGMVRVTWC